MKPAFGGKKKNTKKKRKKKGANRNLQGTCKFISVISLS